MIPVPSVTERLHVEIDGAVEPFLVLFAGQRADEAQAKWLFWFSGGLVAAVLPCPASILLNFQATDGIANCEIWVT